MLPKLCVSLLFLAVYTTAASIDFADVAKYSMVYYDPVTYEGLQGELDDISRNPLSPAKMSYNSMPCKCEGLSCGCCAGINLKSWNINHRACTNFTYSPDEFAIKMAITINEKEIYTNSISAKNPPPACVPVVPGVNLCVRFFDISTDDRNLRTCIDFETIVARWSVLVLHFDCVKIGFDGVNWSKPEAPAAPAMQPQMNDLEVYDEVNFEPDTALPAASNLTPEEENNIGQLKL